MNLLIGSLVCTSVYLGHGWFVARAQNTELRTHITALKRQLAKRGR